MSQLGNPVSAPTSVIKSIQRGLVSASLLSNTSATISIVSVDPSKSILLVDKAATGFISDRAAGSLRVNLTNGTTITITNLSAGNAAFTIVNRMSWQVVEYE